MKFKFHSITKKTTLFIICFLTHLIMFAQLPQIIKSRTYDTQSTFAPANGSTPYEESDKNWALSITETKDNQNNQEGFSIAGFRSNHLVNTCNEPGEGCTRKLPTILKLAANLDKSWEHNWDTPLSSHFVTTTQAGNYLFGAGQHYIGRTGLQTIGTPIIWGLASNSIDPENQLASQTLDKITIAELIYNPNSGKIIGTGVININSNYVNVTQNGEMAIYEFDINLGLESIHILVKDNNNNLVLINLFEHFDASSQTYNFTNTFLNNGSDRGLGIELSYTGGTMPNGNGIGQLDGYVITGFINEMVLNNPNVLEVPDEIALLAKVSIAQNGDLSLAWSRKLSHVAPHNTYINPPIPAPDCQILDPNNPTVPANTTAQINSLTSSRGFKCIQNSAGEYIFTVAARYLDVTTDVRQRLDCSINTNFNTFFRQGEIYLFGLRADGTIFNHKHLGQFSGEDFVPEVLETNNNQYVVNGAVSNNAVIDPYTFGGLENAGRLVFVNNNFTIAKDYPFFEGLNDLCTFSTDYTADGNIVICANNNANFDDYAIIEVCPNDNGDSEECNCLQYEANPFPIYEVNADETINNSTTGKTFARITVKSGNTLTITGGVTLEISERIIVERNAKLVVDNATLTAPCDNLLWTGIEVYGNPALGHPGSRSAVLNAGYPQNLNNPNTHGVVILKNATIEYAVNGVKTKHFSQDPNPSLHNGIVMVANTKFVNNVCGVVLIGNNTDVISELVTTQFIINDDYRTGNSGVEVPITQVRLKNISDYRMHRNTFISHQEEYGNSSAIWANDADFNLTSSKFTNFDHAIEAYNGLTPLSRQTKVQECKFYDNARAMVFSGYHADINDSDNFRDRGDFGLFIYDNEIQNRDELQGHFDYQEGNWAIRLDGCADYLVSQNKIDGGYRYDPSELETQSPTFTSTYGLQAIASPTIMGESNYIQKNEIGLNPNLVAGQTVNTILYSGVRAWEDNPSLQILCNSFSNDMRYAENFGAAPTNQPVALDQGNCGDDFDSRRPETAPAGNTFVTSGGSQNHKNLNMDASNNIDVDYHYTGNTPTINGVSIIPQECFTNVTNCNAYENDQHYVQTSGGGANCPILQNDIAVFEKYEQEIQQNMALLTVYGRQDESNSIYTAKSVTEIKNLILRFDVFLSDNELMALAKRIGDFPAEILTILEENAPLNNTVLEVLNEAISNAPDTQRPLIIKMQAMVDNLFENTTGVSLRTEKEREVRQLATIQLAVPTKYIPQACTKKIKPEEVLENLVYLSKNTALNKLPIQQFVLDESIKIGNFDLAKETLSQIEIGDNENLKRLVLLKQFEIDMLQAGKTIQNLTKQELVILNDLAGDEDPAGIMARNTILGLNEETIQFFTPETKEQDIENVKKVSNPLLTVDYGGDFVYPNPGSDFIAINVTDFAEQAKKLSVKIYSASGYLATKIVASENNIVIELGIKFPMQKCVLPI